MLGWWFWDTVMTFIFQIALFTVPDNSFIPSIRYEFSRIFKSLIAFSKNWSSSSDVNRLSNDAVFLRSARVTFFAIFLFPEKMFPEKKFFPERFLVTNFYFSNLLKKVLRSITIYCNSYFVSYILFTYYLNDADGFFDVFLTNLF